MAQFGNRGKILSLKLFGRMKKCPHHPRQTSAFVEGENGSSGSGSKTRGRKTKLTAEEKTTRQGAKCRVSYYIVGLFHRTEMGTLGCANHATYVGSSRLFGDPCNRA